MYVLTHSIILISVSICYLDSGVETVLSDHVTRHVLSSALDFCSESNQPASAIAPFGLGDGFGAAVSDEHTFNGDRQHTPSVAQDSPTTTMDSNVLVPGILNAFPGLLPQAGVAAPQAQCDKTRSEHVSVQADMYLVHSSVIPVDTPPHTPALLSTIPPLSLPLSLSCPLCRADYAQVYEAECAGEQQGGG